MPKLLSEIIRAKLYKDPNYYGASVSQTRENNPQTKSIKMSDIKSTFEPGEKTASATGSASSRKNVSGMVDTIRKGKVEDIPPINVRRNPAGVGYEVLDGHHRFQAHQEAGVKNIRVKEIPPIFIKNAETPKNIVPPATPKSTVDTIKSTASEYASKALSNPVIKTAAKVVSNPVVGGIMTAMEPTPANAGEDEFTRQKNYQSKTP